MHSLLRACAARPGRLASALGRGAAGWDLLRTCSSGWSGQLHYFRQACVSRQPRGAPRPLPSWPAPLPGTGGRLGRSFPLPAHSCRPDSTQRIATTLGAQAPAAGPRAAACRRCSAAAPAGSSACGSCARPRAASALRAGARGRRGPGALGRQRAAWRRPARAPPACAWRARRPLRLPVRAQAPAPIRQS